MTLTYNTFTYTCLDLSDFCRAHSLNYIDSIKDLIDSDWSWGGNDDTLIKYSNMCLFFDEDELPEYKDIENLMVALGG
jgi:hypothetical protein